MADSSSPVMDKLLFSKRFGLHIWSQFNDDDCLDTAAALTYQTLFAVVPLLTVGYSIIDAISAFQGLESQIEDFIFENFVPENGPVIQNYLHDFSDQARSLTGIGVAFLAVTAFLMLNTIERAFNEIWRIDEVRRGFQRFLLYWAVLTVGPLLLGMAIVVTTYVYSLPLIAGVVGQTGVFLTSIPWFLSVAAFTLIYGAVPNCKVPVKHALIGGIVSAVIFEIAKNLFGLVMAKGSWQVIYGTFAAVPLFLFWIYLSWTIILGGAVLVRAMSVYEDDEEIASEPHLFQILAILDALHEAHNEGKVLTESHLLRGELHVSQEYWWEYRRILMNMNLLQQIDKGGYVLSRDLTGVSVWDLNAELPWPLPAEGVLLNTEWKKDLSSILARISGQGRQDLDVDLASLFKAGR